MLGGKVPVRFHCGILRGIGVQAGLACIVNEYSPKSVMQDSLVIQ